MIGLKVTGVDEVLAELRYVADKVPDNGRKMMHRMADKIVKEAQLNAPVDLHNLEDSIHKEVAYGTRGRLQIDVVAGGEVNGVNVDEYASEVHENYESHKPGPGTLAKRAANPDRYVGGKYLERAVDTVSPQVQNPGSPGPKGTPSLLAQLFDFALKTLKIRK